MSNAFRTIAFGLSLGKCVAEHGEAADRFGLGRLVLQNVPVLFKNTVFESNNVGGDPSGGPPHSSEAAMRYDVVSFSDYELALIAQRGRQRANEVEQARTPGLDMGAVLDISIRPVTFGAGIVTLVEKRIECFEDEGLILFR